MTRRQQREEVAYLYDKEMKAIEQEIRKVEAEDIFEMEMRHKKDWVNKYMAAHKGKPPPNIKGYRSPGSSPIKKPKKEEKPPQTKPKKAAKQQ